MWTDDRNKISEWLLSLSPHSLAYPYRALVELSHMDGFPCAAELSCHCGREIINTIVRLHVGPSPNDSTKALKRIENAWLPRLDQYNPESDPTALSPVDGTVEVTAEQEQSVLAFLNAKATADTHARRIDEMFSRKFGALGKPRAASQLLSLHTEFVRLTHFDHDRSAANLTFVCELLAQLEQILLQLSMPSATQRIQNVDALLLEANQ